jgi:activator of 2-hydroxyglutaryl-CoA dehydratase
MHPLPNTPSWRTLRNDQLGWWVRLTRNTKLYEMTSVGKKTSRELDPLQNLGVDGATVLKLILVGREKEILYHHCFSTLL